MPLQSEFDAFKAQWTERAGPEAAKMMLDDRRVGGVWTVADLDAAGRLYRIPAATAVH